MNIEQARFNMIEQQIRPCDVLDSGVLSLLGQIKREDFVPEAYQELAFADLEIPLTQPIKAGRTLLAPKIEARILQELAIRASDTVLEIGTGNSGFGQIALYERCGFVRCGIDVDYFRKHSPTPIFENGVECRHMVRLRMEFM